MQTSAEFHNDPPPTGELAPDDFAVRAEEKPGFNYPYTAKQLDWSETPNHSWQGSLPESARDEQGVYAKPGFDLQAAVDELPGPILEIAGPTPQGYRFLNKIMLPTKPIVTNYRGNLGSPLQERGSISLNALDRLVLDALADARALPIADKSVGMVLFSDLIKIDEGEWIARKNEAQNSGVHMHEIYRQIGEEVKHTSEEALRAIEHNDAEALSKVDSPRIAGMLQTARVLKPGGLVVARGLDEQDVSIMQALGLELVMHTPSKWMEATDYNDGEGFIHDSVFQKPSR